jgi:hypothetical protein
VCAAAKPAWRSRSSNAATVDGRGAGSRTAVREHRPARRGGQRARRPDRRAAPATITPPLLEAAASAPSWSWSSGPSADRLGPTDARRPSRRQVAGLAHERVAEGQVEVDRTRQAHGIATARDTSDRQRDAIAASGGPGSAA